MVVDEAKNYSDKVVVISSTVARIMEVVKNADIMGTRVGEFLLMVSLLQNITEFIVLKRDRDKFKPIFREIGRIEDLIDDIDRIYGREKPEHISVVYNEEDDQKASFILENFPNVTLIPYKKLNWMICHGGLEKAIRYIKPHPPTDVVNFSSGFDAVIYRDPTRYKLVPFGAEFPFSIKPYYVRDEQIQHHVS